MHGGAFPQLGPLPAALDAMTALDHTHDIAAWKVYTHLPAEMVARRPRGRRSPRWPCVLERVGETSTKIVCVHKGGSVGAARRSMRHQSTSGRPRPHPRHLRFVIYHSGFESGGPEGPYTERPRTGVESSHHDVAQAGIGPSGNVCAELGLDVVVADARPDPGRARARQAARPTSARLDILWGTDSIWYGSPQDQIQAFRAFEIAARAPGAVRLSRARRPRSNARSSVSTPRSCTA